MKKSPENITKVPATRRKTRDSPAWTVLLIAASALERDGATSLSWCFMFVVTASYFGLLAFGGAHAVDGIKHAILGA
jgi:hypothetical protein